MAFRKIQTTNLTSSEVAFSDPLIILNKNGTTPTDVGFLGKVGASSYTGIVKDSSTGEFILVDSITLNNQTINDINALDASLTKGTITAGTIKADTIVSPSIPADVSDLTDTTNLLTSIDLSAVDQDIIPDTDNTRDLGSPTKRWRDLYLGPGSLYINNKKVISDESNTMEFKTDADQSLTVKTTGTGVLTLQSDTTVNFAANLQIASGKAISSNDGTVTFSDKIDADNNQIINVGVPTDASHAATKGYIDQEIDNIVNGAPAVLDTLNELANAIGDDANFATTITSNLAAKADTTYVNAEVASAILTASTDATTKANSAQAAAIIAAASDATTKANTAQSAAQSASALDATTKANTAQSAAIAAAATDATSKANTALVDAKAYTDATIPTAISAFTNDAGYALTTQLFSGNYNDLTNTPTIPTAISAFTNDAGYALTTQLFSGNYNDLTNTPTIPTVPTAISAFTNDSGYLTSHQDLTAYALKTELFSGSYTDLTNTPAIPSISGLASETYVDTAISNLVNGANASFDTLKEIQDAMATDAELATAISNLTIPSTTSALTNDSGFATQTYVDTAIANNSSSIEISSAAPTGASSGDLWWDDVDGLLNVYYDGAWVEASPASSSVAQGTGSGLDADLLDGQEGSYYQEKTNAVWINNDNTNVFNNYNENIRLRAAGNGVSVIAFNAPGTGGSPNTSILGYTDRFETRIGDVWRTRIYSTGLEVNGAVTATGDVTAYSDDSLKTNVQPITGALGKVEQVTGVTFDRIADGSTSTGVVAQELEAVLPEAVKTDDAGLKHVAYGNITGLLIEAVKELDAKYQDQIKQLTDQIEELKRNG